MSAPASAPVRPGVFRRLKLLAQHIIRDARQPIPAASAASLFSRLRWRITLLFKKYGWKLLLGVFVYYLIRDTILYIIIPLLIIRHIIGV